MTVMLSASDTIIGLTVGVDVLEIRKGCSGISVSESGAVARVIVTGNKRKSLAIITIRATIPFVWHLEARPDVAYRPLDIVIILAKDSSASLCGRSHSGQDKQRKKVLENHLCDMDQETNDG